MGNACPPACSAASCAWNTGDRNSWKGLAIQPAPTAPAASSIKGNVITIGVAILTACIGACLLAAGVRGYLGGALNALQRLLLGIGALLLIGPGYVPPLIGLTLAAGAMLPAVLARGARARVA